MSVSAVLNRGARVLRSALRSALLLGVVMGGAACAARLNASEVVTGTPGVATYRATVNFKGMANFQKFHSQTNIVVQRPVHPWYPLRQPADSGGAGVPAASRAAGAAGKGSPAAIDAPLAPNSPATGMNFQALDDDLRFIPPDTMGAVGPGHVMTTLNSQVRIQDRDGNILSTVNLDTFWSPVGGMPQTFDPKVLYDQVADRWIFTAGADGFLSSSAVLIGVTQTGDPTGNWFLFRVDADAANANWADYPSIGFNKDWIVVSWNIFPIFTGGFTREDIYVFNKTNLYANGTGLFTRLSDSTGLGFTMVPSVSFDNTSSVVYLVEVDNLINNFVSTSSRLRLSTITGPVTAPVLTLGTALVDVGSDWASSAPLTRGGFLPQLGTTALIEGNDSRIQNVVFRNGSLWTTHHICLPAIAPTHAAVQWFQLTTAGAILQSGRIEDLSGVTSYAFPNIAVNKNDDALIGYSRFSAAQYASANYSFRYGSDPTNTLQSDVVFKAGEAPYNKTFGSGDNRWGDYSSTMVDPVNDIDMWTIQEYADTPGGGFDRWATWWTKVDVANAPPLRIEFSTDSFTVREAIPGFATITVLNPGGAAGSVDYATADGTALSGTDYFSTNGTLNFQAGQIKSNFTVMIIDNGTVNSNKTVLLTLSNPTGLAVLGTPASATLTILDDDLSPIMAGEFNFSSYVDRLGQPYLATENEFFFNICFPVPVFANDLSAPGALITVVRTNGSTGRVLVDYETADGGTGVPGLDYLPASGTLVFDDFQMSSSFIVPVFSDAPMTNGFKFVRLVLSNPRPAPEEELQRPGFLRPTLGLGSEAGLFILEVNSGICVQTVTTNATNVACIKAFTWERTNYRFDEYPSYGAVGGTNQINLQLLLPGGGPGSVQVTFFNFVAGFPLTAGSDYAESPNPSIIWPNPIFTDPALGTNTDFPDYGAYSRVVTFGVGQCRATITVAVPNDGVVEFNEDILAFLEPIIGNPPVNSFGAMASVTILFDDQPAGALDREWNPDNIERTLPPFNFTPGANNEVKAVAVQPDFKTLLGGDFDHVNARSRNRIARLNADGSLDTTFEPGTGADSFVSCLVLYPLGSPNFGKILIAGGFTSYNGFQRNGIARLLPGGALDPTFAPGNGADGPVRSIALLPDERIIVAGNFTTFNDVARNGVARLNANGALDLGFDIGPGPDGTVFVVAGTANNMGDQKVLIAGDFQSINGQFFGGIAQLNADGTLDPNFNPGGGVDGPIYALAVQTNKAILIAGDFVNVDARARPSIARLNADGSLDPAFDSGSGADNPIYTITLQPDQKALIGGLFTSYNGTRRLGLARLRPNGTLDTSFLDTAYNQFAGLINTFSFQPPNFVNSIALQPDGNVMIGGSFTNVGGNASFDAAKPNAWTVFTRADKRTRFNIARILGSTTPGPGNAEFDADDYFIDENAGVASVKVQRTDGRLGTLGALTTTLDRTATNRVDYVATSSFSVWPEGFYQPIFAPLSVGKVAPVYFPVPILDNTSQDGDRIIDLRFLKPDGSITLGGEFIPLGGALGRFKSDLVIGDNDFPAGTFNFLSLTYVVVESNANAIITVIRTNGSVGAVSVDFFTRNSTNLPIATANVDYTPVRGTLFFPSGVTNRTFIVPLIRDNAVEFDENIGLVLTNAAGGARLPGGTPVSVATATLTIVDDDFKPGRLNFGSATYMTNENAGAATIVVTRTGGSLNTMSVQYRAVAGTAAAGIDFTPVSGTLNWNDGEITPKTFTIPLLPDGMVDGPKTVSLFLTNSFVSGTLNPAALGERTNATLTITDDDAYGVLTFSQPFYQADENAGRVTITVVRNNGLSGNVSVDFDTTPVDPLSPGTDYFPTNGTLRFGPGEFSKTFTIALIDDPDADGNKDIMLTLVNPTNATVGLPNPVTLTIVDNESFNIPPGQSDPTFVNEAGTDGPVYALSLQQDQRLLLAGDFAVVNNIGRHNLARLNTNGTFDASFDPGVGPNAPVRAMASQTDGHILIGGFFSKYQATNRSHIARLFSDGALDATFNPGSGADNPVYALTIQPNGKILVGGAFSAFNSITRPGIVRLNTNGIVDLGFNVGAGANDVVFAVALQNDGKIIIGGDFTAINGTLRHKLARLNPNGSLDTTFLAAPLSGPDSTVRAIFIQPDGQIVIGGSFTNVNGIARSFIARLNPADGALDIGFLSAPLLTGGDNTVYALAQQVDGKLIVAGDFQRFNGVTRNRLTRLNTDGSTDPTINFGNGAESFVATVLVQPDRAIVLGGGFTTYDDQPRRHIARIFGGSIAGSGSLEFSRPDFLVNENDGLAAIGVRRRGGTTGQVGVDFTTSDNTAIDGIHYLAVSNTVVFPEGETKATFLVPIIDNTAPGGDRIVDLTLVPGTFTNGAVAGPQPSSQLIILDDEGMLTFSVANFSVNENVPSGTAPILIQRLGATNTLASVDFTTANGTATAFQDYIPTNGTMVFLPGEIAKTFHVRILMDSIIEGNETVLVSLRNPSGSNTLGIASATLVVVEDDFGPGRLLFSAATYASREGDGTALITVVRTNGSTGIVSVRYATSDATALAGLDYIGTNNILAFADGERLKTFQVPIIDDRLVEPAPDERFLIRLFSPTGGASLGAITNAVVTIRDNDTNTIVAAGAALLSESFTNPPNSAIDPGETVNLIFALTNIGNASTTNLIATLLPSGGVTAPDGPKNYGTLIGGGPIGTNSFMFTAVGSNGNLLVATFLLTEGGATNGFVQFFFTLGGKASRAFASTNRITINDNTKGSPYPSDISVANLGGVITKITVTLSNLTHTFPEDIDLALVGPGGQSVMLMSDVGGSTNISNVKLVFDDVSTNSLTTAQIVSGTYKPSNIGPADARFPDPAPPGPYSSVLSVFIGTVPNGVWSLYVVDDNAQDGGSIAGWSLSISTTAPIGSAIDLAVAAAGSPNPVMPNSAVTYTINVTNHGPSVATGLFLTNTLPAGVTLGPVTVSQGTFVSGGGKVVCNFGNLARNARATATIVVTPTANGSLLLGAQVVCNEVDFNMANNSTFLGTMVGTPVPPHLGGANVMLNHQFQLTVTGQPGQTYVIEASTNLRPNSWTPISTNTLIGASMTFIDVAAPSLSQRFYRVVHLP